MREEVAPKTVKCKVGEEEPTRPSHRTVIPRDPAHLREELYSRPGMRGGGEDTAIAQGPGVAPGLDL